MALIVEILILLIILTKENLSSPATLKIIDLSKCKIHFSRSETSYTNFFEITENFRYLNDSLVLDFHFAVQAPSDAHILLSPSNVISNYDPVYEIVLGAGANIFSEIRRLQKAATKKSKTTKDLLSSFEPRSFWLHVFKDGLIEIGKAGEELAFLSWKDPSPLPIKVFSFCTWNGVEAKWYYDCLREDETVSQSQKVETHLSATEKLRKDLLSFYDPYVKPTESPDDTIIVSFTLDYNRVILDEMNSKLIVDGTMNMEWLDEKIFWNSSDYDDIEHLNLFYREIWQPDLVLYNAASGPGTNFLKSQNLFVNSKGAVTWFTQVHMETWCDSSGLGHWPNDDHTCEVQIGFWMQDQYVILVEHTIKSSVGNSFSEWKVKKIEAFDDALSTPWNLHLDYLAMNVFIISFSLERNSKMYTTYYFVPLIAISISVLVSFWLQPVGSFRITLYCIQFIILSLILTKLASIIPAHPTKVPYLLHLYSYSFIGILIALIFTIIFMNWLNTKHQKPLPYYICSILNLKFVKTILYASHIEFSDSYGKLINNDSTTKLIVNTEMWNILITAIDRMLFIIYFILIIVFLSKQF